MPGSPYPPRQLPTAKQNGGGVRQSFLPQRPLSASQRSFNWCIQVLLQLPLSTVCSQIEGILIYRESLKIRGILWWSKSGVCKKDKYDRWNALWLGNHKNHCCENAAPSLHQSFAEVRALEFCLRPAQRSRLLVMCPADLRRDVTCSKISLFYMLNQIVSRMPLHNCTCFQEHLRMLLYSLRALWIAAGGPGSACKNSGARVRTTGESRWLACDRWIDWHCAVVSSAISPVSWYTARRLTTSKDTSNIT